MSYVLKPRKRIAREVKRVAREEVDNVITKLSDPDNSEDINEAIHEARKSLKKLRGLARLVRDEVGNGVYKRENVCYRDAARKLSSARDSIVQIETLQALRAHYADQLAEDAFAHVERCLQQRHEAVLESAVDDQDAVDDVLTAMHAARLRIADWSIKQKDFDVFADGLQRVYQRGRTEMRCAYAEPTTEHLHEWRKRVKYLRYQVDLLHRSWPNLLPELEQTLHDLTDYLGDDHDLAVLRELIAQEPDLCQDEAQRQALLGLIDRRRGELQAAAWPVGARVYAEKPKAFVKRMGAYWEAAARKKKPKKA